MADDEKPTASGTTATASPATTAVQPVTVGRTQWDAAVDIVRLLGNGAPYLIIVGLAVFGFLKFQEQNQKRDKDLEEARSKATESYRAQLSEANERLIKTYESMGSISATQIKNLSETLTVQKAATARTKELQDDLENLNKRAIEHRRESETAKREAEKALTQRKEAEVALAAQKLTLLRNLESLQNASNETQADLLKKRKELQDLEQKEKDRQRSQGQAAEQISEIRKKMYELARAVRDRGQNSEQLALEVLKDAELTVADGESIFISSEKFIGRSDSELVRAIGTDQQVRYAARMAIGKPPLAIILAAQSLEDNAFRRIATYELDGSRVVSVEIIDFMAGVLVPAADDWFAAEEKFFLVANGRAQSEPLAPIDRRKDEWDLSQLGFMDATSSMQPIKGGGFKTKYLSINEFEKLLPDRTKGLEFEAGYSAFKRSLTFSVVTAFPQSVSGVPADLRETVIRFLDVLVKRDKEKAATFAVPSLAPILGQVAAVALRPNFQFVTANLPAAAAVQATGPANSVTLVATYNRAANTKKETASFRFSNIGNAGWKLEQFIPAAQVAVN